MITLQYLSNEITKQHRKIQYYRDMYMIGAIDAHFSNTRIKKANLKAEKLQAEFDELYKYNNI